MRDNLVKKLTALFLAITMVINISLSGYSIVYASSEVLETLYIDGIKYVISLTDELNVKVDTKIDGQQYSLEVDKMDGTGKLESSDNLVNKADYEIEIENLSEEETDLKIFDNITGETQHIDSVDELLDEAYEGQAAITFEAIAGETLLALIAAALVKAIAVVVVAGVTFYAVTKIANKIRKGSFYPAVIRGSNVLISPRAINRSKAVQRLKNRMSTYTILSAQAKGAVKDTHMGVTKSENHYSSGKKGVFFSHYHTLKRRGEHSFYGLPKVRK